MKIIFFGTPHFVVPVLETLIKHHEVVAVVTAPDRKSGRKQLLTPSPTKIYAEKHNIPVLTPDNLTHSSLSEVEGFNADLSIVAAYGQLIPASILEIPKNGSINIHPSLLPKYRGPSPLQAALLDGLSVTGVSIMQMDEQIDHGPLHTQVTLPIASDATFATLVEKAFQKSIDPLLETITQYATAPEKVSPKTQNDDEATYTKIITKQDGFIDLDNPPEPKRLDRMIRAYYPWPTVWTQVTPGRSTHGLLPGGIREQKIIKFLPNNQIQMEGKQPVSLKDFLNGYPEMRERIEKLIH